MAISLFLQPPRFGTAGLADSYTIKKFRIVGHDGQAYAGCAHLVQPRLHGVLQHLTVVSGQGVIHVEHEGFDAVCREKIRVDALDGFEDVFRG